MRAVCLVALTSCAVSLPVPLEPAPTTKPPNRSCAAINEYNAAVER
jgi:hypothetical protein